MGETVRYVEWKMYTSSVYVYGVFPFLRSSAVVPTTANNCRCRICALTRGIVSAEGCFQRCCASCCNIRRHIHILIYIRVYCIYKRTKANTHRYEIIFIKIPGRILHFFLTRQLASFFLPLNAFSSLCILSAAIFNGFFVPPSAFDLLIEMAEDNKRQKQENHAGEAVEAERDDRSPGLLIIFAQRCRCGSVYIVP